MSDSRNTSTSDHTHCKLGLFHNAEPLHTHPHCKNCFRMRRCEGSSSSFKLLRCTGCNIATYCSRGCQKAHWKQGHKVVCKVHSLSRDRAIELSGNPKAWSDFTTWIDFHHTSIINMTVACFLDTKDTIEDAPTNHMLHISLDYRNDPSLPPQKQFEVQKILLAPRNWPECPLYYDAAFKQRPLAVEMGKKELGKNYWGTGAYFLMVRFRPKKVEYGVDGIPFWKHFGIDKWRGNAKSACGNLAELLGDNLEEGRQLKFCCGKIPGLPTCCCGGWTHEISGHSAKRPW